MSMSSHQGDGYKKTSNIAARIMVTICAAVVKMGQQTTQEPRTVDIFVLLRKYNICILH